MPLAGGTSRPSADVGSSPIVSGCVRTIRNWFDRLQIPTRCEMAARLCGARCGAEIKKTNIKKNHNAQDPSTVPFYTPINIYMTQPLGPPLEPPGGRPARTGQDQPSWPQPTLAPCYARIERGSNFKGCRGFERARGAKGSAEALRASHVQPWQWCDVSRRAVAWCASSICRRLR